MSDAAKAGQATREFVLDAAKNVAGAFGALLRSGKTALQLGGAVTVTALIFPPYLVGLLCSSTGTFSGKKILILTGQ